MHSRRPLPDARGPLERLPDGVVVASVAAKATAFLRAHGLEPSPELATRSVSQTPFAPRSVRRALLTLQVNPGSLYRCSRRTLQESIPIRRRPFRLSSVFLPLPPPLLRQWQNKCTVENYIIVPEFLSITHALRPEVAAAVHDDSDVTSKGLRPMRVVS